MVMVHKRRLGDAKWRTYILKDGTLRFTQWGKYIDVHKSMGNYWIDYGMRGGHVLATMVPVKTLKDAMKMVDEAKKDGFVWKEKR